MSVSGKARHLPFSTKTMTHTRQELESLTSRELVNIFNEIPGVHTITRFSSRMSGVNRILSLESSPTVVPCKNIIRATEKIEPLVDVRPAEEPAPLPEIMTTSRKRTPRGTYTLTGGPTKRPYRTNTQRGKLLTVLTEDGATFERLRVLFPQWDAGRLHRTIRMLSNYFGFDFTTDDQGVIRASR